MDAPNRTNTVKTAKTTLRILEEIKRRNETTVTELAGSFELSKSSIHNYLNTLEAEGYIVRTDNEYRIALRFLDFGGQARQRNPLYRIAKDEIDALAEDTGEVANLMAEEHGKGIYLHRSEGEQAVQTDSYIGQRVCLHNTALGKAVLAYSSSEYVSEVIERHGLPATTENTVTDPDELRDELDRVREAGVAFDDQARVEGLRCVGVPIINNNGGVEGAISISGPTSRLKGDYFRSEIPSKLKDVSNVVQLNITYT
jgi:DNA-binding IclR family transcriptional regulator